MAVDPFLPFLLRVILGSMFFFQAYDKIFRVGLKNNYLAYENDCQKYKVPIWFMKISVVTSSYIELIGGLLLIFGLFRSLALFLLGINLIMVSIGLGYMQGLWDTRHVFPRLVLFILFCLFFSSDTWALDYIFQNALWDTWQIHLVR